MITYLHGLIYNYPGGTSFKRTQIDEILESLEHIGMMPPLREEQIIYDNEQYTSFAYKWEDEDEKK